MWHSIWRVGNKVISRWCTSLCHPNHWISLRPILKLPETDLPIVLRSTPKRSSSLHADHRLAGLVYDLIGQKLDVLGKWCHLWMVGWSWWMLPVFSLEFRLQRKWISKQRLGRPTIHLDAKSATDQTLQFSVGCWQCGIPPNSQSNE